MVLKENKRSRMFYVGGKPMQTWNCFVGCRFDCTYCNARKLAETRLKNSPRYCEGFVPHQIDSDLGKTFKPGEFVFIAYMGDISFARIPFITKVLHRVAAQPEVNFLTCSRNPIKYRMWPHPLPANLYLGTTIETNRDYHFSKAPDPFLRYQSLFYISHPHKFISIEPICDFDLAVLTNWLMKIKPEIIEVGADNYHNDLPEPKWWKVEKFLRALKGFCPNVVEKVGLERLKQK